MSGAKLIPVAEGLVRVRGVLDFSTAADLLERGAALFQGQSQITVDLQGVERADSAGLVLLFEWVDRARHSGKRLEFRHVPASLLEIARLTNSVDLLPAAGA